MKKFCEVCGWPNINGVQLHKKGCSIVSNMRKPEDQNNSLLLKGKKLTKEEVEQLKRELKKEPIFGPRRNHTEEKLRELERRIEALEKSDKERGMSGKRIGG